MKAEGSKLPGHQAHERHGGLLKLMREETQ
jgi:hypothetical protein